MTRIRWSFNKMHPLIQRLILFAFSVASMGYLMAGSWLLYSLIK